MKQWVQIVKEKIRKQIPNRLVLVMMLFIAVLFTIEQSFSWLSWIVLLVVIIRVVRERNKTLFIVTIGLLLTWWGNFTIYQVQTEWIQQIDTSSSLMATIHLDPATWRVNGDLLMAEGYIEVINQQMTSKSKVAIVYRLKNQKEQAYFSQETAPISVQATVKKDEIEGARNRHGFSYETYLLSKQIPAQFTIERIESVQTQTTWFSRIKQLRNQIIQTVRQYSDSKTNAFASAIILGDKQQLDLEQQLHYKELGLSHLLTISGLHITMLMEAVLTYSWRLGMTRERSYLMTMLLLLLYGWLIGWSISGSRAIIMGLSSLAKRYWKRRYTISTWDMFALVTCLSIVLHPFILLNTAFKLSYGMTAVLLLIQSALKYTNYSPRKQSIFQVVFLALFAIPFMATHFFEFNILSTVLTIALTFFFAHLLLPILLCYIVAILLHITFIADFLHFVAEQCLILLDKVLVMIGNMNIFSVTIGYGKSWIWGLFLLVLCWGLYHLAMQRITVLKTVMFAGIISCLLVASVWHVQSRVIFIDVGQGDATAFVQKGVNRVILVDTGGQVAFHKEQKWQERQNSSSFADKTIIAALKAEGLSKVDYLILTHADADHIGNVVDLAKEISIQTIVMAKGMEQVDDIQRLMQQLSPETNWMLVEAKDTIEYGELTIQFLGPLEVSDGSNETSLSMSVSFMQKNWLLLGDLDQAGEGTLLQEYPNLRTDVLKIAHHGSKSSTNPQLLESVKPTVSIISAGKNNRYHHPNQEVLGRLEQAIIPYIRTDLHGAIHFVELPNGMIRIDTILTKESLNW